MFLRVLMVPFLTLFSIHVASCLTLLSDLPTPAFLFDVPAIQRFAFQPHAGTSMGSSTRSANDEQKGSSLIPSFVLPHQGITLYPCETNSGSIDGQMRLLYNAPLCETIFSDNDHTTTPETSEVFFFLHASVVRSRGSCREEQEDPNTFIAELDLPPSLCRDLMSEPYLAQRDPARLCLGLNNHHVGGYYWARSLGSGSSMRAPGVRYVDGGCDNGILQWDKNGPHASNTNDGKRSEWVNFIGVGDTVQLIPVSAEYSLVQFVKHFDNMGQSKSIRVYGVTTEGRPLGSEPSVVCEFRCDM